MFFNKVIGADIFIDLHHFTLSLCDIHATLWNDVIIKLIWFPLEESLAITSEN